MSEIKVTAEENEIHIIQIKGEVDASSSIELDQAISSCISGGYKKILVDLSQLSYISSAGLGVFMSYVEEMKEKQIKMILFGLTARVAHTFDLLGLRGLIEIRTNREEANKSIHEV